MAFSDFKKKKDGFLDPEFAVLYYKCMEHEEPATESGRILSERVAAAFFSKLRAHKIHNYKISEELNKTRSYISKKSRGDIPIKWEDIAALAALLPDTTPEQLLLQIAQEINNLPSTPPPSAEYPKPLLAAAVTSENGLQVPALSRCAQELAQSAAQLAATAAQLTQLAQLLTGQQNQQPPTHI